MSRNSNVQYGESGKIIQYSAAKVRFFPTEEQADLEIQLRELARELVSSLSVLEPTQSKNLLGAFVSDLFLSVAEQERREFRRQKQAEGIAAAKARGVHFGPQPRSLPDGFEELRRAWREKRMTLQAAAAACGIPKTTFREAALRAEMAANGTEDMR